MRSGQVSETARRVAAYRLSFERVPLEGGRPEAEDTLARDVAGPLAPRNSTGPAPESAPDSESRMGRYLAARTQFFDRTVVGWLIGGGQQVVTVAAGYDGRALRYGRAGVAWFEIDHPDTQADKRSRLDRLQIDATEIRFAAVDLGQNGPATVLTAVGFQAQLPTLFLVEGLLVYLAESEIDRLVDDLATLAANGSRLAVSASTLGGARSDVRDGFARSVAAMDEPARSVLTTDQLRMKLTAAGWRLPDELDPRMERAGFFTAVREGAAAG